MGFLNGLIGNASQVDLQTVRREYSQILTPHEVIEKAYKLVRDMFIFTDKRLLLVDKQGLTGKKVEYHSIPYHSISHYSIETAGHLDLDAELKIFISGSTHPIVKAFNKNVSIYEVQSVLSQYILK
ncbi:PH domain-containing protein [Paenibacillus sp. IHBB 10380]|uniref:PH domain-containing protein n=1 Tax=Paenibacillus sp. IHBB 10380 TaxID=1566358 RepID=UPI0005CFECF9|nr:PH domain-containing protein [Paenibacillus sp. IHBB 10380]AJS57592.1 cytoplasmic protein [Paenibacillus sp. IHBB 10380]